MFGRFVFKPVLMTAIVVGALGAAVHATDTDSLSESRMAAIAKAFDERVAGASADVDALDPERLEAIRFAFETDLRPALTFAAAERVVAPVAK